MCSPKGDLGVLWIGSDLISSGCWSCWKHLQHLSEAPPATALSIRGPQRAEKGGSGSEAPVPNLTVFLVNWVGGGVDTCQEGLGMILLICIPAAGEVTVLRCTWLSSGFHCDRPPRLNEDQREWLAMMDSTEAHAEIHRGNVAGSAMRSRNSFRKAIRQTS